MKQKLLSSLANFFILALRELPVRVSRCFFFPVFSAFSVHSALKLFAFAFNVYFELLTLKNNLCQRQRRRMRDAQCDVLHSELLRDFSCFTA